jgi:hypothetical protein
MSWPKPMLASDLQDDAGARCGAHRLYSVGGGRGERLLRQHVLAGDGALRYLGACR